MKTLLHPMALLIANAGVFAALTVASAEVAYNANEITSSKQNPSPLASDIELANAKRIIDSMERHGINDPALKELKNDLSQQIAIKLPKRPVNENELLRYHTADGRWRAQPIASPSAWEIQPVSERDDYTPVLENMLKSQSSN